MIICAYRTSNNIYNQLQNKKRTKIFDTFDSNKVYKLKFNTPEVDSQQDSISMYRKIQQTSKFAQNIIDETHSIETIDQLLT